MSQKTRWTRNCSWFIIYSAQNKPTLTEAMNFKREQKHWSKTRKYKMKQVNLKHKLTMYARRGKNSPWTISPQKHAKSPKHRLRERWKHFTNNPRSTSPYIGEGNWSMMSNSRASVSRLGSGISCCCCIRANLEALCMLCRYIKSSFKSLAQ